MTPTYRPQGWRDLSPNEMVEYGDWFWANDKYIPVILGSKLANENSRYIRKLDDVPLRGKW
jgi:hypothetical protein